MTYKHDLYQGFENDPTGSLSESLVSAWSLTELAGPRRDSAGSLDMRTTSNTRYSSGATPNTGVSTGVKHTGDKFVAQFDGSPDGANISLNKDEMMFAPLANNFGERTAMSFAAWVYVDSTYNAAKFGMIASQQNSDLQDGWFLGQYEVSTNQQFSFVFGTANVHTGLNSTTNLSTSTWYHVVCTWDGTNRTLYVNGSSEATDTPTLFGALDGTAQFNFGRSTHTSFPWTWHGRMCHAAMWIKSLSAAEVTTLYNGGVPNRYKPWKGE